MEQEHIDELFDKAGGCGWFQVLAFIALGWGMSAVTWFVYEVGFLI